MVYSIYKVINKQVWLINACHKTNSYCYELVPGAFLKKLIETKLVSQIDANIIIEELFMFEEIIADIKDATFFACLEINTSLKAKLNYSYNLLKNYSLKTN